MDATGTDVMEYVSDSSAAPRGNVIHLTGDDFFNKGLFVIGDIPGADANANDVPFDTTNGRVGMWVKSADTAGTFQLTFHCEDGSSNLVQVDVLSQSGTDYNNSGTYILYVGTSYNDGTWRYLELDLPARVAALSGPTLAKVHGMFAFAKDIYLDDVILSKGLLEKSYQLIPGAQIGAYIGTQSGSNGGTSQSAWAKWYHQYNDLGTVHAITDSSGVKVASCEPDFYGNYRYVSGTRPDTLGLTSKFYDSDAGLYYFNARWYDQERGRWMSTDPLSRVFNDPLASDGVNLYCFVENRPAMDVDPTGLFLGFKHGNYCGWSTRGPGDPIDEVDAACQKHDDCLATWADACKFKFCNIRFCAEVAKADCNGDKACKKAKRAILAACLFAVPPLPFL